MFGSNRQRSQKKHAPAKRWGIATLDLRAICGWSGGEQVTD